MKEIKLLNLVLTNFKGIRSFELKADGNDLSAFGDNGTGKSTLFDGFVWLLFDKDSQNKKDFQIKTLVDGKVLHKLNHEVEATFLVDDTPLILKKVFTEKWTKKRGNPIADFTGHTTDYFIDGVPSKKKEYDDKVQSLVDEGIFKLLTSPSYFNEQLHWTKRRELLLEIAGDITDEDVINSNTELSKLTSILGNRSIEGHKKAIAAKRKEINQELERIPVRIDELHRSFPDTNGLNESDINKQLESLNTQIEDKQQNINDIKSGGEVSKLRTQIDDIDLQISNLRNDHKQQEQQAIFGLRAKLQEEQSNVSILQSRVGTFESRKSMNEGNIKDLETRMNDLRNQWKEQNALEFDHESNCMCPTCNQELPQEQVTEIATKFNRSKSQLLETINNKGIELKNKVESIQEENVGLDSEIQKAQEQITTKQNEIKKIEDKISTAESNIKPLAEDPLYQKLLQDRQVLEQQIDEVQASVEESVLKVIEERTALKEKQSTLQIDLSKLSQAEQSKKRIAELEEQERELAAEFDKLEHELHLTEEFIRTKVNLLEEKINSKFKYARFQLFKNNINGGLEETCETLFEGVPYSSGLNNAARINVGLDIINTLSQHYGVQAPIFVDNAESVTRLLDIDSQVISLVVSESDKQLRVESKAKVGVA